MPQTNIENSSRTECNNDECVRVTRNCIDGDCTERRIVIEDGDDTEDVTSSQTSSESSSESSEEDEDDDFTGMLQRKATKLHLKFEKQKFIMK